MMLDAAGSRCKRFLVLRCGKCDHIPPAVELGFPWAEAERWLWPVPSALLSLLQIWDFSLSAPAELAVSA